MESLRDLLVLDLDKVTDALFYGDKVLEASKEWDRKLAKQQKELDSVLELSAMSNSEVHSGNIGDPTPSIAMRKIKIEQKMGVIRENKRKLEYAMAKLPPQYEKIIRGMYFTKGKYKSSIVDDFCNEYDISPRQVYEIKRKAILELVSTLGYIL